MARPTSSPDLKDVLTRLEPAVAAVDRAEAAVAAATEAHKGAVKAASTQRNAAILAAKTALDKAKAAYERAEADAVSVYTAAIDGAEARVRTARQRHADACTDAAPLLEALQETTDRVKSVAGRRRT